MSADARMRQVVEEIVDEAVGKATEPLRRSVEELSARLAAVEASGGPGAAPTPKGAVAGRTAKSVRAGAAEAAGEAKA